MLLPLTNAQRCQRFGHFKFSPNPSPTNPERIAIHHGWAESNITSVACPQLDALFGRPRINIHYKAAGSFAALWQAWYDAGLLEYVVSWDGSWVPRYKRGRAGGGVAALSNHSWGTAFDINAHLYPLGRPVPADSPMHDLAQVAEELGWFWGGNFKSRPDGMHFEYTGLAPATTARAAAEQLLGDVKLFQHEVRARQRLIGATADGVLGPKTRQRAREVLK